MKKMPFLKNRILTISEWATAMAKHTKPKLLFSGNNRKDYLSWRKLFEPKYFELLGQFPKRVPLNSKIIERRKFPGYIMEKVIFNSERFMSVIAWVCYPSSIKSGRKFPAVICCHGHGNGKDGYVGIPRMDYQKTLAVRLAEAGYLTIAPDWRGFGERNECPETNPGPRDICDVGNLFTDLFGYHLLTLDIWDGIRTVDYLLSRKDVDASNIGCVGCSFGGTMTTFLSAADKRIKSACISGYLISAKSGIANWNNCGSQTLPGLLQWGDRAEIAGLICPRPLMIQIGQYDSSFPAYDALKEYNRVKKIYKAYGVEDKLGLDLFDGCHEIHVRPIIEWFDRWFK